MDKQRCPRCGAKVPQTGKGRPRKWCTDQCAKRAWDEKNVAVEHREKVTT